MRRSFPFHDLGDEEFETLVAAICQKILGTGSVVFAAGKDGGRDGKFEGTAQLFPSNASPLGGKFIIQSKHTSNPVGSCSDSEFGRILDDEKPKITTLIGNGELDHYLVFTNRKRPANDAVSKEANLKALGLKSAHIFGVEQLRLWLTEHSRVWSDLGFDRFEHPLRIQISDITAVIEAFHQTLGDTTTPPSAHGFTFVPKPEKNKINNLSAAYFEEIRTRSLPYFKSIEEFLKNPRNVAHKEMYDDTADEVRRKFLTATPPFERFDDALTYVIDLVTAENVSLKGRRRFAAIFMHYMYYNCDIGQHADAVETS
jgi:hypothetical protein